MRLEDNMMPILTGLVFAVVLGTTVQNSDDIMKIFAGGTQVEADDDVFFVRAGRHASLDVLANDFSKTALSGADIQIVSGPACGDVSTSVSGISYSNFESCEGALSFSYCVGAGDDCAPAQVSLNVRPAPVAVADAHLPEEGGLVPLPIQSSAAPVDRTPAAPAPDGINVPLNAYVVSFAAPIVSPGLSSFEARAEDIRRLMIDVTMDDLNKQPNGNGAQMVNLNSIDVPLSAVRTARFLAEYGPMPTETAAIELIGTPDPAPAILGKDGTDGVENIVPAASSTRL